ncbi:DUF4180 domain-containing protein [Rhodococcus sp. BP-252]|uniref:Alpha/beta hydrolase n=1 Tax=Rhodococcoides kyotonense TaxID=398843 RepID=A0A177YKP2_9NOCA|nr:MULTISPECIES: DUF4180 domain-containing protein [Rhodococcus]MBY6413743.1 DUF4180 domain-containing protein [Rhodococcus sp. BP-320]MBY6418476.1 DUF4180 domain-containing protein [Rhodococcus sp. BP-321]MBY6422601.1 DUF4180 domain-containing protein [Rhodococcus sp. BP-324]MBY6428382.1 DUF4180 domain-containing protein [Rhodococcus sp. BP-323]MBY6433559.1 DUF4180 domain-containing protein [Rhodococcus sp. BP-322]
MTILFVDAEGPKLGSESDAVDLVGDAFGLEATMIAIPAERFRPEFFELRTRLMGEFTQKLVNYRIRLAIVGDISRFTQVSESLRAFVAESNRGRHIWFVADRRSLQDRIATID